MTEPRSVFDASAIVALLFKERGHEVVKKVLGAGAVTTPTGLAEALDVARRRGHHRTADQLADDLGELGLEIEPLDLEDGIEMARILAVASEKRDVQKNVGGLSLGDAACLAVASRLGLPAVFSDGTWEVLDLDIEIFPFR